MTIVTTELSVNLNAVAQLRNRRDLPWPSVVEMGRIALDAGAVGLTIHPRPDERHIRRHDVDDLAALLVEPQYAAKEYNIEGYPDERFFEICELIKPDQVTFVPDDPAQATSDHGWDISANETLLRDAIGRMKASGMRVALFSDPDPAVPQLAASVGADRVELYTGPYGAAFADAAQASAELSNLAATAKAAAEAGLEVNAGHDLTVENLPMLVAAAPNITEVSIGHGLTADALIYGYEASVKRFITACLG